MIKQRLLFIIFCLCVVSLATYLSSLELAGSQRG